jgi:hypothetical protein
MPNLCATGKLGGNFSEYAGKNSKKYWAEIVQNKNRINFKISSRREFFQKLPVAHGVVVRYR